MSGRQLDLLLLRVFDRFQFVMAAFGADDELGTLLLALCGVLRDAARSIPAVSKLLSTPSDSGSPYRPLSFVVYIKE